MASPFCGVHSVMLEAYSCGVKNVGCLITYVQVHRFRRTDKRKNMHWFGKYSLEGACCGAVGCEPHSPVETALGCAAEVIACVQTACSGALVKDDQRLTAEDIRRSQRRLITTTDSAAHGAKCVEQVPERGPRAESRTRGTAAAVKGQADRHLCTAPEDGAGDD